MLIRTAGLFTTLLVSSVSLAQELPISPFKATYASKWDVGVALDGDVTRSLTKTEDGQWHFETQAAALVASIKESSKVAVTEQQITPLAYRYKRKVLGKKRLAELDFDWSALEVSNNVEGKPWKMAIPALTQDKLSYQLQMRLDLINKKQGPFTYQVADGGKLKTYHFSILDAERVTTPAGEYETVKVKMERGKNSDRITYIWFAPTLEYAIVKLEQTEPDGKKYALQLKSLEKL
ncbi:MULTISPECIES: DUF3108 domain-containing protein [Neptunomonas]|uniref:DUF3108 domain-containing protein n=1 Tax=Neptunomonas marina TaxID=1815562 RepID=A0A437QE70_9GAMM|nr:MULTISPECIES: DUF3108 domain-containing protein [Neptunomonas]RVU32820.1 DUF3108 domain-containing protein [Neptunomonas marina]